PRPRAPNAPRRPADASRPVNPCRKSTTGWTAAGRHPFPACRVYRQGGFRREARMRWRGGRRGGVEDRRGMGGGAMAGGGIGVAVLALIGYFVFGIDPSTTTQVASQFGGVGQQERGQVGSPEDEAGLFVDVIGTNVSDVWADRLDGYQPPNIVLYEQGTGTGCGYGQSAMGPFYCPADRTVYLD